MDNVDGSGVAGAWSATGDGTGEDDIEDAKVKEARAGAKTERSPKQQVVGVKPSSIKIAPVILTCGCCGGAANCGRWWDKCRCKCCRAVLRAGRRAFPGTWDRYL